MSCRCGVDVEQPWRTRDALFSPASLIGGLVVIAFAVLALVAGLKPWIGWLLLGMLLGSIVIAAIVQARRGHRRGCLVARLVWIGLAAPGAPVRLVFSLA